MKNTARSQLGRIQVSDEAIEEMAATAALKVQGVAGLGRPGKLESLAQVLGVDRGSGGVQVETRGREVGLRVNLLVEFGTDVADLGLAVQEAVQEAVEGMTGLEVREVDVLVQGVRSRQR
jgi:uncharacterized alkaline shock family protein YloU